MKIEDVIKILEDKKITVEYLQEARQSLINKILSKPQLIKELEQITDQFWEDAKETGLLFYSDTAYKTDTGEYECISNREQDIREYNESPRHVHAIVLQTRKWR